MTGLNCRPIAPSAEVSYRVMPRLGPVVRIGWKRTHPPQMKEALQVLDDKGTLTLVRKTTQGRYFTHNVSTCLHIYFPCFKVLRCRARRIGLS